jgi:hypothetical protein
MSDHPAVDFVEQPDLFETEAARSLLDQLFADSRLYTKSKDYKELLDFVVRLRNFAPFNAMLLQVQKPGLSYAASASDWRNRFERRPKQGARPLLILWPFGPVALVYDIQDTEGEALPKDAFSFLATGKIDEAKLRSFKLMVERKNIEWCWVDAGDRRAGSIQLVYRAVIKKDKKDANRYRIHINENHCPATQFATLSHELAHLFLGHFGLDPKLRAPDRPTLGDWQREIEAESVAYLVCERNGVKPKSQTYLSGFVESDTTVDNIDLYQVMRAAGHVEALLGLTAHTNFARSYSNGSDSNGSGPAESRRS